MEKPARPRARRRGGVSRNRARRRARWRPASVAAPRVVASSIRGVEARYVGGVTVGLDGSEDDFEQRRFSRHADPEREAVEAGAAMDVETIRAVTEETVVGPRGPREHRPVEPEAHQAELTAVGVAGERQVDVAQRNVPEDAGVVEEEQSQMARTARDAPAGALGCARAGPCRRSRRRRSAPAPPASRPPRPRRRGCGRAFASSAARTSSGAPRSWS